MAARPKEASSCMPQGGTRARLESVALALCALILAQENIVRKLVDQITQGLGLVGVPIVLLSLKLLSDVVHVLGVQAQVPWHLALPSNAG